MANLIKYSLTLAAFAAGFFWSMVGCCPSSCSCDTTTVTCQFASEFPKNISKNTTHLIIKRSAITNISSENFEGLTSLEILDLSLNVISYVHPDSFNQLTSLYYISLENNHLTVLESRTFVNLKLHRLYLSDNRRLEYIHPEAFVNTSVTQLFLQRCSLNTTSILATLSSLGQSVTTLDISENAQDISFEGMTLENFNLTDLTLQNSGINDISFLRHSTIGKLDMSGNNLGDKVWDVLTYISVLRELIIRDIGLTNLNNSFHSNSLLVLNVADNNISTLDSEQIQAFPNLYTLIFENNSITSLPGDLSIHVPRLVVLDASHNRISAFHVRMVSGLSLRVLDLSYNLLDQLDQDAAEVFNHFLSVDLRGNPLHCNCQLLWLAEWVRNLPTDGRDIETGTCGTPQGNAGKEIRDMRDSEFICRGPVVVFVASLGVSVGEQATLDCKAKGDPRPNLELYMGNSIIRNSVSIHSGYQEDRLFFTIKEFNCSQIGNYTCRASNIVGSEEETLHLGASLEQTCALGWWSTSQSDGDFTVTDTPGGDTAGNKGNKENTAAYIIPVVICVVILVFFALCASFVVWNRRNKRKYDVRESENEMQEDLEEAGIDNAGYKREQTLNGSPAKCSRSSSRQTRSLQGSPEKRSLGSDRLRSASPGKRSIHLSSEGLNGTHAKHVVSSGEHLPSLDGTTEREIENNPQGLNASPQKRNILADRTDVIENKSG